MTEQISINKEEILHHVKGVDLSTAMIFMGGSIMEGFGNKTSDIDVYVIYETIDTAPLSDYNSFTGVTLSNARNIIHNIISDGIRYDFEFWHFPEFMDMIKRLNNLNFKTEDFIKGISDDEFDLMHRMKYARPICNEEKFKKIYSNIKFENLNTYRAISLSGAYQNQVEDVQGAFMSDDLGSAYIMTRQLIETAVNAFLSIHGETNPSRKWIYRKLKRYGETNADFELLNQYLSYISHPFDENTVRDYVSNAMRFCQDLNMKVQSILQVKQLA